MNGTTQQDWLTVAAGAIRLSLLPEAPSNTIVSYGFPTGKAGKNRERIGECWVRPTPEGVSAVIFVSPKIWSSPIEVLTVLTHELCHAAEPEAGHKAPFQRLAKRAGLIGKMTSTAAGPELAAKLAKIAADLGPFPAAGFGPESKSTTPKQKNRSRKYTCECGQIVRAATDALEAVHIPCGTPFARVEAGGGGEVEPE